MSEVESDRQSESAYEPDDDSEAELKEEVELMECKEEEEKPKRLFKVYKNMVLTVFYHACS